MGASTSSRSGGGRGGRRARRMVAEINVVPYIDVTLVLLIIFMVTAPLIVTGTIDLPRVGAASTDPPVAVEVTILRDGTHSVRLRQQGAEAQEVLPSQLPAAVAALKPKPDAPIIIQAEKDVAYDQVVKALDRLQRAGLGRVGLAVRQE